MAEDITGKISGSSPFSERDDYYQYHLFDGCFIGREARREERPSERNNCSGQLYLFKDTPAPSPQLRLFS